MSEKENVQLVQQGYGKFQSGDIPGLIGLMSDNIDWRAPEMEGVPFGGNRRGKEGVTEFFRLLGEAQEVERFEPKEFIAQGDKVVVLGSYGWRVKSTGRSMKGEWAHVFTVRDGKITGFQEYTDTAITVAAYRK